jgi:hypothetical protein
MAGDKFLKILLFSLGIVVFFYHENRNNNKKVIQLQTNPNPKVQYFSFIGEKYPSNGGGG